MHDARPARLAAATAQIWWRTLPATLSWLLAAWLLAEVALWGTAMLIRRNTWLALVVFSLGLVATVVATVAALHILGREWLTRTGQPSAEPAAEGAPAAAPNRLTDLVAVTLLPLLGIYASRKLRNRSTRSWYAPASISSPGAAVPTRSVRAANAAGSTLTATSTTATAASTAPSQVCTIRCLATAAV